jgi:hypothetical protein
MVFRASARLPCHLRHAPPRYDFPFDIDKRTAKRNGRDVALPLHQPPLDSDSAARRRCRRCCCSPLALFSFEFGHLLDRFLDMVAVLGLKWDSQVLPA